MVPFAPTSAPGRRAIREALAGLPDPQLRLLPFAHFWRQGWSRLGWPPVERFLGPVDVLHFSDWMYPPQSGGVRSTMVHDLVPERFPEWTQRRTRRMHGAKYRNAARTCDVVFVNAEFTKGEVVELMGVAPEKVVVAYPGVGERFAPEGERADLGRPYVLTVATLEPRKNLETLLAARLPQGHALAVVGAEGWGTQPRLDRPDVIRLGYVDDDRLAALYRGAAAFAYPSRFEGFGIPISKRWRAACRSSRPRIRRSTRRAVTLRCVRTGLAGAPGRRRSRRRCGGATSSSGAGSSTRVHSPGRRPARRCSTPSPRYSASAGRDRRLAAGADARRHGALPPRAAGAERVRAPFVGRAGKAPDCCARRVVVPPRTAAPRSRRRRAALSDLSWPVLDDASAGRYRPRPRCPAPPGNVQPVVAALQPLCRSAGGAGGVGRDHDLRVHQARGGRRARHASGEGARDPDRGRSAVHGRRPTGRRRLRARGRDARAAQESRPRGRGGEADRRRAAGRRRGGLGRGEGRRLGRASSPTRSSPRSIAVRGRSRTRRCTKASGSPCSRRWPAARRSSRRAAARPRRSRARRPCWSIRSTSTSIASGLEEASSRRDELHAAGLERAKAFSWDRVASETWAVYEAVA